MRVEMDQIDMLPSTDSSWVRSVSELVGPPEGRGADKEHGVVESAMYGLNNFGRGPYKLFVSRISYMEQNGFLIHIGILSEPGSRELVEPAPPIVSKQIILDKGNNVAMFAGTTEHGEPVTYLIGKNWYEILDFVF